METSRHLFGVAGFATLALTLAPACGFITGGAAAAADDDAAASNAPGAISEITVVATKESPAMISFRLTDAESDSLEVELQYQTPGEPPRIVTKLGASTNPAIFTSSPDGVVHTVSWEFAGEPDSNLTDKDLQDGIRVFANVRSGIQLLASNSILTSLGNDAPVVLSIDTVFDRDSDEVGVVPVEFTLADSSADLVAVVVEYFLESDPDAGFRLATPAPLTTAPPDAFVDIKTKSASEGGVRTTFFWDTDIDLEDGDELVRLRFTPRDAVETGVPIDSPKFQVDNNDEPLVSITEGAFLINPDERNGIPIPYEIFDEENDIVDVVFQWRRPSESFPPLPTSKAELQAILDDPVRRKELQIATEYPTYVTGRLVPIDENSVRLPEIANGPQSVLAYRIVGGELEILRGSNIPKPVDWPTNPLNGPAATLSIGDGLNALVLDRDGALGWRVREIVLATGSVVTEVASGAGMPTAMAYGPRKQRLFVASLQGEWRVDRFDIESSTGVPQGTVTGTSIAPEGIRAITSLSFNTALITVDDSLIRLNFSNEPATSAPLMTGLAEPWGITPVPLAMNRIYLALRGQDRVVEIDLNSFEKLGLLYPAVERTFTFPNPRAIACVTSGTRLLAITQEEGPLGAVRLRSLSLHHSIGLIGKGLTDPKTIMSQNLQFNAFVDLSTGPNGLRIVTLSSRDQLALGGGLEQRRKIASYDPAGQVANITIPFDPLPVVSMRWRIRRDSVNQSTGTHTFVWDSRDLWDQPGAGSTPQRVFLRATPNDTEQGKGDITSATKQIAAQWEEAYDLNDVFCPISPQFVSAADLDGDGDMDLASANFFGDNLSVFFQSELGVFDSQMPLFLGDSSTTLHPAMLTAADLDGDGALDLVSANRLGHNLTVFYQDSPGSFDPVPLEVGGLTTTKAPLSVEAADLDQDGDLDLVSANLSGDSLTIFFQNNPRSFGFTPCELRVEGVLDGPVSVKTADLDGDGDLDLVSANLGSNNLTVFFQNDPGIFNSKPLVLGGIGTTDSPRSVAMVDIDGDGDFDLVSANESGDNLTIFFQKQLGEFDSTPLVVGNSSTSFGPTSVTAADMDNDGIPDLICANRYAGNLTLFFQREPGVFDPVKFYPEGGSFKVTELRSVTAADLDSDGFLDFVASNQSKNTLSLFFQRGRGLFTPTPVKLETNINPFRSKAVATADLDRDGDLDLVFADGVGNLLTVFFQVSPGTYESVPLKLGDTLANPLTEASVSAADLDGDGDLDLATTHPHVNSISVYYQASPGAFDPVPLVLGEMPAIRLPVEVAAADLDNDGDLDLVSANELSRNLTIFFQSDAGVFVSAPAVVGPTDPITAPGSVEVADLDGDGDLDLATANIFPKGTVMVFFQEPPGVFDQEPLLLGDVTADFFYRVNAVDVDLDGDFDLVKTGDEFLYVFHQLGPGEFDPMPQLVAPGTPLVSGNWALADLDGDGDLDHVGIDFSGLRLAVFWNPE